MAIFQLPFINLRLIKLELYNISAKAIPAVLCSKVSIFFIQDGPVNGSS